MTEEELTDQQELFEHFRFKADPGQTMLRIDKFLTDRIENASRTRIQNAANAGCILVNNIAVKSNYKVKPVIWYRLFYQHLQERLNLFRKTFR
jgi:23S rRNA pseudouridine1911/1915/1917 synthase